jgi:hypothetical protein
MRFLNSVPVVRIKTLRIAAEVRGGDQESLYKPHSWCKAQLRVTD